MYEIAAARECSAQSRSRWIGRRDDPVYRPVFVTRLCIYLLSVLIWKQSHPSEIPQAQPTAAKAASVGSLFGVNGMAPGAARWIATIVIVLIIALAALLRLLQKFEPFPGLAPITASRMREQGLLALRTASQTGYRSPTKSRSSAIRSSGANMCGRMEHCLIF